MPNFQKLTPHTHPGIEYIERHSLEDSQTERVGFLYNGTWTWRDQESLDEWIGLILTDVVAAETEGNPQRVAAARRNLQFAEDIANSATIGEAAFAKASDVFFYERDTALRVYDWIYANSPAALRKEVFDEDGDPLGVTVLKKKHEPVIEYGELDRKITVTVPNCDPESLEWLRANNPEPENVTIV